MFPCAPSMVEGLRRATDSSPAALLAACKSLRNACIGAPKRKRRFVEFGIIPALADVVIRRPNESKEALVTLGSLATDEDTLDQVVELEELPGALWQLVMNPAEMSVAEAAARVLKSILALRPDYSARWSYSEHDILFLVQCESVVLSTLGARLVSTVCLTQPGALGATLAFMRPMCESVARNSARSNDDALALAAVAWLNPDVSLLIAPEPFRRGLGNPDKDMLRILYDFWCMSLGARPPRPAQGVPPPSSCVLTRPDAGAIMQWALSICRSSAPRVTAPDGDSGRAQREVAAVQRLAELLEVSDLIRDEAAIAVAVFCALDPRRQDRIAPLLDPFLQRLGGKDSLFIIVALLCATGSSPAGLRNARAVLTSLLKRPDTAEKFTEMLSSTSSPAWEGAVRLVRQLTYSEESLAQIVKLGLHAPLIRAVPGSDDAMAALINLTVEHDSPGVWEVCDEIVRRVGPAALDRNNALAWALLTNLAAGARNLEHKRAFVQSGISLARLVSERGLPVLRNLCAGGSEHAALVESIIQPALTLVASGIDFGSGGSEQVPLEFICNAIACGEPYKAAILGDTRLLNVIARGLDASASSDTKLAALRCITNLTWSSEGEESPSGSGRSPMLRLVQAHVMAAARSPLRFTGMQTSSGSSSSANSGRQRLVSLGILDRVRWIASEEPEGLLKTLAHEVIGMLS